MIQRPELSPDRSLALYTNVFGVLFPDLALAFLTRCSTLGSKRYSAGRKRKSLMRKVNNYQCWERGGGFAADGGSAGTVRMSLRPGPAAARAGSAAARAAPHSTAPASGSASGRAGAKRGAAFGFTSSPPVREVEPPPPQHAGAIRARTLSCRTVSGNRSMQCGTRTRIPYERHVIYRIKKEQTEQSFCLQNRICKCPNDKGCCVDKAAPAGVDAGNPSCELWAGLAASRKAPRGASTLHRRPRASALPRLPVCSAKSPSENCPARSSDQPSPCAPRGGRCAPGTAGGREQPAAGRGAALRHFTDDSLGNKRKAITAMLYHPPGPAHSLLRSLL